MIPKNKNLLGLLALLGEIGYSQFGGEELENELMLTVRISIEPAPEKSDQFAGILRQQKPSPKNTEAPFGK